MRKLHRGKRQVAFAKDLKIFGRKAVDEYTFRDSDPETTEGRWAKAAAIRLIPLVRGWVNLRLKLSVLFSSPGFSDEVYQALFTRPWVQIWSASSRVGARTYRAILCKATIQGVHSAELVQWIQDHDLSLDFDDLMIGEMTEPLPGLPRGVWEALIRGRGVGASLKEFWESKGYNNLVGFYPHSSDHGYRRLERMAWVRAIRTDQLLARQAESFAKVGREREEVKEVQPVFEFSAETEMDFAGRKGVGTQGELAFRSAVIELAERKRVSLLVRHVGLSGDGRGVKVDLTKMKLGLAVSCRLVCPDFLIQVVDDPDGDFEVEVKTRSRWLPRVVGLNQSEYDLLRLWTAHSAKRLLVVFVGFDGRMCWAPFDSFPKVPEGDWHSLPWEQMREMRFLLDEVCPNVTIREESKHA